MISLLFSSAAFVGCPRASFLLVVGDLESAVRPLVRIRDLLPCRSIGVTQPPPRTKEDYCSHRGRLLLSSFYYFFSTVVVCCASVPHPPPAARGPPSPATPVSSSLQDNRLRSPRHHCRRRPPPQFPTRRSTTTTQLFVGGASRSQKLVGGASPRSFLLLLQAQQRRRSSNNKRFDHQSCENEATTASARPLRCHRRRNKSGGGDAGTDDAPAPHTTIVIDLVLLRYLRSNLPPTAAASAPHPVLRPQQLVCCARLRRCPHALKALPHRRRGREA